MAVTKEMQEKWKREAIENQKAAHDMIHEIGKNYSNNPEQIAELLEFGSRFYQYSLGNVQLIYSQNRGATYVQSFDKWKEMDTSVLKGQKGLKIFVPVIATVLTLENGKQVSLQFATDEQKELYRQGKIEGHKQRHFKIGNVFDISQTSFPTERYPELYSMGYSSEQHAAITEGLIDFCKDMNIPVSFGDVSSIALRGYYDPSRNEIVVNKLLNDTQRLSTLSHEIGHALENHGVRDISTEQKEFEADSISILIQSHFGMELTDSRKAHLADHYKKFTDEVKASNPGISDDDLLKKVDAALGASMKVFREHVDHIQKYVAAHVDGIKMYYDPEYDREVTEDVIKSQYAWFSEKSWFHQSYDQFKAENFREINTSDKANEAEGKNDVEQQEVVSRRRHGR